jgi:hypothetical protein
MSRGRLLAIVHSYGVDQSEVVLMGEFFLLQSVLRTVAAVFGGFGIFYLILSFSEPSVSGPALVLLGAASGIAYYLDR